MKLIKKTILITGASSGIGRAVALELGKRGNQIVVTARRDDLLKSLAAEIEATGAECLALKNDALDESAAARAVEAARERFGGIDVALLNIGSGPVMNLANVSAEEIKLNMAINYDTMVNFLVPLIRLMKEQRRGVIAQTNSLAGFLGLPMQGPYSAAKAAGRILLDAGRLELRKYNIKVINLYPGFVGTHKSSHNEMPKPFEMSEAECAEHIIHALEKEKNDYLFPFSLRWLIRLGRVLPKRITGQILMKVAG